MSIILSATAFESELTRLYRKWTKIAKLGSGRDFDEQNCEELLRACRTIKGKIMDVAQLLHPAGLDDFVLSSAEMRETIRRVIELGEVVQQEDVGLCEVVQRGLRSSSYRRGRYSVRREQGVHHFHSLLLEFLEGEKKQGTAG